ncbi:MAG: beta-ketoacyl synthase chain length factor [Bacteroidota bacterium]
MDIYINSLEAISPQNTFNTEGFLTETIQPEGNFFSCQTPKYSEYLDPKALRRMSKIVRMGVTTAKTALKNANVETPDAIIVGTGLGCIEDTTKFLSQMIDNNEQLLNPTAFIQSTHNTVSGQIALMLGCRNYNLTYTQKSISFESALLDAYLMLKSNEAKNILVGGIDEITEDSHKLMKLAGCTKNTNTENGYTPGEGSTFFVVSNEKSNKNINKISDISLFNTIKNNEDLIYKTNEFLSKNNLSIADIDVFISGANDDLKNDKPHSFLKEIFSQSIIANYKHLVGEYDTASAFSVWLASKIIETNSVPRGIIANSVSKKEHNNILIYNSFNNKNHSLILLSKC